jgi:dUTPase
MFTRKIILKVNNVKDKIYYQDVYKNKLGLELYMLEDIYIPAYDKVIIDMGIKCEYNNMWIMMRSWTYSTPIIMKNHIQKVTFGETIKFELYNTSDTSYMIKRGESYVKLVNEKMRKTKYQIV